jgi:hypothetical protein
VDIRSELRVHDRIHAPHREAEQQAEDDLFISSENHR